MIDSSPPRRGATLGSDRDDTGAGRTSSALDDTRSPGDVDAVDTPADAPADTATEPAATQPAATVSPPREPQPPGLTAPAAGPRGRLVRVESLTGLRWWAALFVFVGHVGLFAPVPFVHLAAPFGRTGVTFFFILSGFVLTWSMTPDDTAPRFWWRRFARVWPAHAVATLLALPVFYAAALGGVFSFEREWNIAALLATVLLLHAWVSRADVLYGGNPASWSLSCEMWFYALFPWAVRPIARLRERGLVVAGLVILTAPWLVYMWQARIGIFDVSWLGSREQRLAVPLPLLRTWEFLLGIVLACLLRRGRLAPLGLWPAIAGLGVALIALIWWRENPTALGPFRSNGTKNMVTAVFYGWVIWAAASLDVDGKRSWLRSTPMVRLGQWSYAFYLVHATVIYGAVKFGLFTPQKISYANLVPTFVFLVVSIVVAWLLYSLVEAPVERRLRRMLPKPAGAPAAN